MAIKPKKMAVLKALQAHGKAMSLTDLLALLGDDFAARTTRRWLTDKVIYQEFPLSRAETPSQF